MRKILYITISILVIQACNKQGTHFSGFEIDGTISGLDSSYVVLKEISGGTLNTMDSTYILNGIFTLRGYVESPELCYLIFGDIKKHTRIFIENSKITFNARIDSLDNAIITGSKSHAEFQAYEDEIKPFENKMVDLYQQYRAESDQYNKPLISQIDSLRHALNRDMETYIKNYIGTHRSSIIAPYILSKICDKLKLSEIDSILKLLDKSLFESPYIVDIDKRLQMLKRTEPGNFAPVFEVFDTLDNEITPASFKGKILLISFWASWNATSRRDNQLLLKTYKELNGSGLEVLGVALDKSQDDWLKAIKKDNLPWKQVADFKLWESDLAVKYGINEIPFYVLIDRKGVIVSKNPDWNNLVPKIKELIQ